MSPSSPSPTDPTGRRRRGHPRSRHLNILLLTVVLAGGAILLWSLVAPFDTRARAAWEKGHEQAALLTFCLAQESAAWLPLVEAMAGIEKDATPAWAQFRGAAKRSETHFAAACDAARGLVAEKPLPRRLAEAEAIARETAAALAAMRPAFEKAYASLDAAERARLDALVQPQPRQ
jgi:hypothetical protein